MNKYPIRLLALLICLMVSACNGDSTTATPQADPQVQNDPVSCPVVQSDVAEPLFTESDREWFCTVTADAFSAQDQVFFFRNGQAVMTRFREVFWNRSAADESINVASPFISPFVIRNIFSANTVLTFDLVTAGGVTEAYDCVLVGREDAGSLL